jgi:hypothetical protein
MKLILSLLLICILIGNSFSQEKRKYQISSSRAESSDNNNSMIYKTYFLLDKSADSTIFSRDSILFSKDKIDGHASLNLYNNSTFNYEYTSGLDTIYTSDELTGAVIAMVVEKTIGIAGEYSIFRKQCSEKGETKDNMLSLLFKNGGKANYTIEDIGKNTVLVKK